MVMLVSLMMLQSLLSCGHQPSHTYTTLCASSRNMAGQASHRITHMYMYMYIRIASLKKNMGGTFLKKNLFPKKIVKLFRAKFCPLRKLGSTCYATSCKNCEMLWANCCGSHQLSRILLRVQYISYVTMPLH